MQVFQSTLLFLTHASDREIYGTLAINTKVSNSAYALHHIPPMLQLLASASTCSFGASSASFSSAASVSFAPTTSPM